MMSRPLKKAARDLADYAAYIAENFLDELEANELMEGVEEVRAALSGGKPE